MRLSQGNGSSLGGIGANGNPDIVKKEKEKETKQSAPSNAADKLKASNFPASLLKIGSWEYLSRYEGDLVAKCYYAKHKLVWEVLDGGLKSKIEIQWSDITALKANYSDDGSATLDIVTCVLKVHIHCDDCKQEVKKLLQEQEDTMNVDNGQESLAVLSERRKALFEPLKPTMGMNGRNFSAEVLLPPPDFDVASYPKGWLIGKKRKLVNVDVVENMRRIVVQEMNRKDICLQDREIDGLNEQLKEDALALEHLQLQLLQERSKRTDVERENTSTEPDLHVDEHVE